MLDVYIQCEQKSVSDNWKTLTFRHFFLFMDKCDLIGCSTLLLQKGFLNKYVKNVFWGLLLKGVHKNSFCALIVNFVMRMMQICLCRIFLLFFSVTASRQPTESYYAVFCIFTEINMDSFGGFLLVLKNKLWGSHRAVTFAHRYTLLYCRRYGVPPRRSPSVIRSYHLLP